MRLKLFKKYFFTTFIIIAVALSVMMLILSVVLNSYIAKNKQDTLLKACNEVIAVDWDREQYVIFKKSRQSFKRLRTRYQSLMQQYQRRKAQLCAGYRAAYKELVSEEYWMQKFN